MSGALASLFGGRSFKHGIHPQGHKDDTEHLAVERMPFVGRYVMPLSQHAGAPSRPVVRAGERIERGQVIAEPGSFVSTTLHSPVTGTVKALAPGHHPSGLDTVHFDGATIPPTSFSASPRQPGSPQAPQFEPGSISSTSSRRGSSSTRKKR